MSESLRFNRIAPAKESLMARPQRAAVRFPKWGSPHHRRIGRTGAGRRRSRRPWVGSRNDRADTAQVAGWDPDLIRRSGVQWQPCPRL